MSKKRVKLPFEVLTIRKAAEFIGVDPHTVKRRIDSGDLDYTEIGGVVFVLKESAEYDKKNPPKIGRMRRGQLEELRRLAAKDTNRLAGHKSA